MPRNTISILNDQLFKPNHILKIPNYTSPVTSHRNKFTNTNLQTESQKSKSNVNKSKTA